MANKKGYTPLIAAALKGYVEVVRVLLADPKIDIDHQDKCGVTTLCAACQGSHREIVELLLDPPDAVVQLNDDQKGQGMMTVDRKGANIHLKDENGMSPMLVAASNRHFEIIKLLHEHLLKVGNEREIKDGFNTAEKWGQTPLHYACGRGHDDVIKYLVDVVNVDILRNDNFDRTALQIAQKYER